MKLRREALRLGVLLALAGCRHTRPAPLPPIQAETPAQAAQLIAARRPERFKMVHQVAASYQGRSGVMQGYLLGRSDGSFRVSATAAIGPRLFDAVKRGDEIQTRVYLKEISEKLDVRHIVRAIDRVYFLACPEVGQRRGDDFVARCPVRSGDDVDELEEWVSARFLEPVVKRYFLKGQLRATVTYAQFEKLDGRWVARRVQLVAADGYRLDIALEEYVGAFPFDDALLAL